jgi:hypothetical protein
VKRYHARPIPGAHTAAAILWSRHFSRAGETVASRPDTRRPHCSADPGFRVGDRRCNGFRQSGCDRSTILARARFNRSTVKPLSPHTCMVQAEHPSPTARQFRLLLNGLTTYEQRQMFPPKAEGCGGIKKSAFEPRDGGLSMWGVGVRSPTWQVVLHARSSCTAARPSQRGKRRRWPISQFRRDGVDRALLGRAGHSTMSPLVDVQAGHAGLGLERRAPLNYQTIPG